MVPVAAPVHRLSVEDVYRMVEAGVLHEHDRVELVEGVLLALTPPDPPAQGRPSTIVLDEVRQERV